MLYCKHCKVELSGNPQQCPLCQSKPVRQPDGSAEVFPAITKQDAPSRRVLAWIAFGTVSAAVICIAINLILPAGGGWSVFVAAGIASLWFSFYLTLKKRKNLPKNILWQVGSISLLAYLWDRFTGFHGWSIDYVLPSLCTCAMIAVSFVAKIRRLHIQEYILYLVMVCILGVVSFVLLAVGAVQVVIPSAICFASSVIFFASLLFFQGKALWAEIQRRLHL